MTLTAAGNSLQREARRIVEAAQDFKERAESLRRTVSGELVFGMNNSPDVLRMIPILRLLTERHPELSYELITASSGVVLQGLDEGTISVGFFEGNCDNPRIAFDAVSTSELCLVAPAAWAKELSTPDWKALEKKPWIFVSPMCSYFRTVEHICQEQGLQLQARFRSNEDFAALRLVAEGLGVTITSRVQLDQFRQRERLFVLPHFQASLPLCLGYLASRVDDPAVRAVRSAVLEVWGDAPHPVDTETKVTFAPSPATRPRRAVTSRSRRS
jgi:DNA-binding transcriptional LysR family regulator